MIHRYRFGIAAVLLGAGAVTYFATRDEEQKPRARGDSTVEEPSSETLEAPPRADSFTSTTRQPSSVTPDLAEPVVDAPDPGPAAQAPEEAVPTEEIEDPEQTAQQRAQLIRLPVISAIRGSHATPAERYRAMREALERSGPSSEPWTQSASAVFDSWSAALPQGLVRSLNAREARCFLAGCEVEVRFESTAAYEQAAEAFRSIPDEGAHGGRVQTPPVQAGNGGVVATWMMLRPNVAPSGE